MSAGAANDNAFGGKHPVDLCEPKATKESILLQLKRLTGFLNPVSRLCHLLAVYVTFQNVTYINDGMSLN